MCGLVIVKRKDGRPAYKSVLKRYRKQKTRGTEGFGYIAVENDKIVSYKRAPTEHEIIRLLMQETASEIAFHHRNPTSAPNLEETAHPILVENEKLLEHQYFVMHNGVIRNHEELKKEHEKQGFSYVTELAKTLIPLANKKRMYQVSTIWNDSEALAIEIALAMDGKQVKIGTQGPAAVFGYKTKGTQVVERFFFRNELNPLHFEEDKHMVVITSNSMGHGKMVDTLHVNTLKAGGGFEETKLFTPWSYKRVESSEWSKRGVVRTWNKDKQIFEEEEYVPYKPTTHPIGFLTSGNKNSSGLLEWGGESEDDDPLGDTPPMRSLEEVLGELEGLGEKPSFLGRMSTSELYDEWQKALDIQLELKLEVGWLEDLGDRDALTASMEERYEELKENVEKVDKYIDELLPEIQAREAVVTIIDSDIAEQLQK